MNDERITSQTNSGTQRIKNQACKREAERFTCDAGRSHRLVPSRRVPLKLLKIGESCQQNLLMAIILGMSHPFVDASLVEFV